MSNEEKKEQSCENCVMDGICFVSLGLRKLFDDCGFVDLDEAINEDLSVSKGDVIFATVGGMCDAYVEDEHNCEECDKKDECAKENEEPDTAA